MLVHPERLADDAAETIAFDAAASDADCHCKAETRPTFVVPERSHAKESIAKPLPARVGGLEIRLTA
jgi:hypothetical protein